MKRANSELVTVNWLLSLPDTLPDSVASSLPPWEDWKVSGTSRRFTVMAGQVGGSDLNDAPLRRPVMQLDFFASRKDSATRPPWGAAFTMAEDVVACTEVDSPHRGDVVLELPHGFEPVEIRNVDVVFGPRRARIPDPASYACVSLDVEIQWTRL